MVAVTQLKVDNKQISIKESFIHYSEVGSGDPIIFVHGMPTSSYLWRNIIPVVGQCARCIAPDLIGMGESGKPAIDYSLQDHIDYFESFVEQLNLDNITLVVHGWGSVIALDFACRHPDKIKALCLFESHIRPATDWDMLSLPVQQLSSLLKNSEASYKAIIEKNYLVENLLPSGVIRSLTDAEMQAYRIPFATIESRMVLWRYIQELPLGDGPKQSIDIIQRYSDWLLKTNIPKLMLYAMPGFITTMDTVSWANDNMPNLQLECLENVMHFAQESEPEQFAEIVCAWYQQLG